MDVCSVHKDALKQIDDEIRTLQERLARAQSAREYHASFILNGIKTDVQKIMGEVDATSPDLAGATKHEAAEAAIINLGGKASVPSIVAWLIEHNYGGDLKPRMLDVSIRTALHRKEGKMFRRIKDTSMWEVISDSA